MNNFFYSSLGLSLTLFLFLAPICQGEENYLSPKQVKIERFLRENYCEEEKDQPVEEGDLAPDDPEILRGDMIEIEESDDENFCLVKRNVLINPSIKVLADDRIEIKAPSSDNPDGKFIWSIQRKGKVQENIKQAVLKKLFALQLPPEEASFVLYKIWKINVDDDSFEEIFVQAFYRKLTREDELKGKRCEITVALDKKSKGEPEFGMTVLNKIPFKDVDFEIDPEIEKDLYDIRDVDGDRKLEVILFAKGYEASWLEVFSKRIKGWYQSFKGLGYSL